MGTEEPRDKYCYSMAVYTDTASMFGALSLAELEITPEN